MDVDHPTKRQKVEQQCEIDEEKNKILQNKSDGTEIETNEKKSDNKDEGEEGEEDEEDEVEEELEERKENSTEIVYVYSPEYTSLCTTLPIHRDRAPVVHSLLAAYGLLNKVKIVAPIPATDDQLTSFHSDEYIEQIKEYSKNPPNTSESKEGLEHREGFGLAYDCHPFPMMYDYVAMVAGASLVATRLLCEKECIVAINTEGGRHHGKKDQASGFCYVNDIVISILALLETFERVLYIDVDIHHGDGVEEAFYLTKKVVTLSFHKQSPGFFPGSGKSSSIGSGRGKNHTINVPLPDEIDDETYFRIFRELTSSLQSRFRADVIVMQCGSDTITGDPLGEWNLTPKVVGECAKFVVDWGLPTLLLGGGGYKSANVARVWAYILDAITKTKEKKRERDKEQREETRESDKETGKENYNKTNENEINKTNEKETNKEKTRAENSKTESDEKIDNNNKEVLTENKKEIEGDAELVEIGDNRKVGGETERTDKNDETEGRDTEIEEKVERKQEKINKSNAKRETKESIFTLPEDIPEHPFFALYGPDFRLPISSGFRTKVWKDEEIEELMALAKKTISCIPETKS
eukprot:Phypoly_transcript_06426.p1 GENE.Phypoly_transcript_06426~~Phypoly_transcript_06426.p1  ORF type:complete len:581 (+),score=134.90 Phypoly_transcript_06426:50-1792(+)